ncbi:PRC-barrel domain-containing protein [Novosphingobium terrae]|uniref:PRC-barrel domain-containing protein n=1 Tax=Novosphingobium terrae TaxID=2726189 RepID=UPI001982044D|nr:PRC-barrel domain-containing protein [Novosphingobium terrae]
MNDPDLAIEETSTLIASNKVEGSSVYNVVGDSLGSIYNFMVEKRSGQVRYAVLQFGGLFGLGSDYYPIPWEKLTYDSEKGGYIVDIDRETLEGAPHYSISEDPVFDRDYGSKVFSYYGLAYP